MSQDDSSTDESSLFGLMLTALILFFILNFLAQLAMKPTEVFRLAGFGRSRTPGASWMEYEREFRRHSTKVMTPDFLAALAQTESSGNPYAQPPWIFRLTLNPWRIYAPASSAVGLMQITNGNLEQARRYCVKDNRPALDCALNAVYSRLSASDSIEMTSAYLQTQVDRLAPRKTPLRRRQMLAAVVHLCGPEKGPVLVRAAFNPNALGVCGRQDVGAYVRRVMLYRAQFEPLASRRP